MDDELPVVDNCFIALTRPPVFRRVPVNYFALLFVLFGYAMIIPDSLTGNAMAFGLIVMPMYGFGIFMTERDPHWMSVLATKAAKCPNVPNKRFWKSVSYNP